MQRFYYKQNRLKQLRAFCSTAHAASMSKAAEQMFLSQPSVSLLIQALEKDLDTRLFDRAGPRIELTSEGRILLDLALPLVEGLENLPNSFSERCGNPVTGYVEIAAGESTTLYLLPEILARFTADYPQIQVKVHNIPGREGISLLQAGQVDFAMGPILEVPDNIWYHPLYTFAPVLITPLAHPLANQHAVSLADITPYGLIMPPKHMSTRSIIDIVFQQHDVNYSVKMEAGGWEVIKKYVEIGLGISIVTSLCLTGEEKLAQVKLTDFFPVRSYGIALQRGKFISAAAQRFIELIDPQVIDEFKQDEKAMLV